jgi:hypothetical protein
VNYWEASHGGVKIERAFDALRCLHILSEYLCKEERIYTARWNKRIVDERRRGEYDRNVCFIEFME